MSAVADVTLPKIFGDSMVLQRDRKIPVWGWASKNERITVTFQSQKKTAQAGADGKWSVMLDAMPAGGPFSMTIKGKNTVTISDILIGEVWICSGQSNMEWTVSSSNDAEKEIAAAAYPLIRHIKVLHDVASEPRKDLKAVSGWNSATAGNIGQFTAVGYFFARELHNNLKIPIGLINTSWGGTDVETWTSREAYENSDEFKEMIAGIPRLNLDSLAALKKQAADKKIRELQGGLPSPSQVAGFSTASVDATNWPSMKVPGVWESQSLPELDGVVWFTRTVELTSADLTQAAELHLAMIDDVDETYINGTRVGSTTGYNQQRQYKVPTGVLKQGSNRLAVRVHDTGGGGGFHGNAEDIRLVLNGKSVPLAGEWKYNVEKIASGNASVGPNSYPTLLFNSMINPIIPYAIKGVLWYQGENNAGRAYQYRKAFPLMIEDWRNRWKQGDFPFYFVQLATFNSANGNSEQGSTWAELREAQTMTLKLPNTGMAITTDIGDPKDIHPRNKQDVGKRLALIALNKDYGKSNTVYQGPTYESHVVNGNKVELTFTGLGSGLMAKDKYGYLRGFEIAGADQKFHFAKAEIKDGKVIVYADAVTIPVAVRYAWADDASEANLFNKEGLPADPFRTDKWKGITETSRYSR